MGQAKINLLGEEVLLAGEEDSEYLARLAARVEEILVRVAEDNQLKGQPTRCALLAAVNLMDELTKLEARHSRLKEDTSAAFAQMARRIEDKIREKAETPAG